MSAMDVGAVKGSHDSEEPTMQAVTTIGLDIAKSVFQVHGIDTEGNILIRRQLKRRSVLAFFQKLPPCLIGVEACATSQVSMPQSVWWILAAGISCPFSRRSTRSLSSRRRFRYTTRSWNRARSAVRCRRES